MVVSEYIIEEAGRKFDRNIEAMFWEFTLNEFNNSLRTLNNLFVYVEAFCEGDKPVRDTLLLVDDTAAIGYALAVSSVQLGRVEPDDLAGPEALPYAAEYGHSIVAVINGIRVSAHSIRNAVLLAVIACIRKSIDEDLNG